MRVADEMKEMLNRIAALEESHVGLANRIDAICTAFVPDDLGRPGFDWHRTHHLKQMRKAQEFDSIKIDVTKRIVQAILTIAGGAIVFGATTWIRGA